MRLKQKTKNIIGGTLTLIFVITIIVIYQMLVVNGEQFKIQTITLDEDKEYLLPVLNNYGICEGSSIFGFHSKKLSKKLEEKLYHIRSVEIEKKLPSNVVVKISHRTPVMRLSENLLYVVDDTGKIFMASQDNTSSECFDQLPILLDEKSSLLRPGDDLTPKAILALTIVTKFNSVINPSFKITRIDTSNEIYLILHTNTNRQINMAWDELTTDDQVSSAIEIAVNAMIQGRNHNLSKLIVLVKQKRCFFTR